MTEPSVYTKRISLTHQIRLLSIQPSADRERRLECHLKLIDLDDAPPYEALSYVWGAKEPTIDITCNDIPVTIRTELTAALQTLRHENRARTIWVDAICINQNDNEEKNHQVPLMGKIYSQAKRVVVWLGKSDARQMLAAVLAVRLIASACREYAHNQGYPQSIEEYPSERFRNMHLPIDIFTPEVRDGLRELYGRPYFSRIWCIQEISLARDVLVLWRSHAMTWSEVGLTAAWIFDHTPPKDPDDPLVSALEGIDSQHADLMYDPGRTSFLQVLRNYYQWKATDPRDKVYGLLNLVAPEYAKEIPKPDYAKSVGHVYADTVVDHIRLYSQLLPLVYVNHHKNYDGEGGYRSWAPYWDRDDFPQPISHPEQECPYSACDNRAVKIMGSNSIGTDQLRLLGILYDVVVDHGVRMDYHNLSTGRKSNSEDHEDTTMQLNSEASLGASEEVEDIHPYLAFYKNAVVESADSKESHIERGFSFAHTLTAGFYGTLTDGKDQYVYALDDNERLHYYKDFLGLMCKLKISSEGGTWDEQPTSSHYENFETVAERFCRQRRLFKMSKGSFGLGPQCMRAGDIVVVLYGGKTPYVLRPRGDKYLFMGQAYVDEIMHGQLILDVEQGRRQEKEFCLI